MGYAVATAALVPRWRAYMSSTHLNAGWSLSNRGTVELGGALVRMNLDVLNSGGTTMRPSIEAAARSATVNDSPTR